MISYRFWYKGYDTIHCTAPLTFFYLQNFEMSQNIAKRLAILEADYKFIIMYYYLINFVKCRAW